VLNENRDRIVELLEELVKWTKVTSIPNVKKLLLEILPTPEEKLAYQLSDGSETVKQVANGANVAVGTVSGWWKKWIRNGISEPISVMGGTRARRLFSLDDFSIEIPHVVRASPEVEGGTASDKPSSDVGTS
jgi:hypothetical protein